MLKQFQVLTGSKDSTEPEPFTTCFLETASLQEKQELEACAFLFLDKRYVVSWMRG